MLDCARSGRARPLALFLLLPPLFLAACGGGGGGGDGGGTLTLALAPSQADYAAGSQVVLEATLSNGADGALAVCDLGSAVLHVQSLTRNGTAVVPVEAAIETDEDYDVLLEAHLKTLAAGAQRSLSVGSAHNADVGGQAFQLLAVNGNVHVEVYDVSLPGTYEVKMRYQYPAGAPMPDNVGSPIFQAQTNEATASFTVMP